MKSLITFIMIFAAGLSSLLAGESQTQLLAQPILAHGGSESWGGPDIEFKVVDVPFLDWPNQGRPAYAGIAQTNQILSNAPRSVALPESNLLALYGVGIGYDFITGDLWLRLESARAVEGWRTTVDQAAFAALECIRIVAVRYHDRPKIHIGAPKGAEERWKAVEERFNRHDFQTPFPDAETLHPTSGSGPADSEFQDLLRPPCG